MNAVKEIDRRIASLDFPCEHPRISRAFRHLADFIGQLINDPILFPFGSPISYFVIAEEVLVLLVVTPVVFFGLLTDDLDVLLVQLSKIFLSLVYQVDRVTTLFILSCYLLFSIFVKNHLRCRPTFLNGVKKLASWRGAFTSGVNGKLSP